MQELADYIARDSPASAVRLLRQIRRRFIEVSQGPLHFQLRPDIGVGARVAWVGRYAVLFRLDGDAVRIERVIQGNRNLGRVFRPEE